MVIIFQGCEFYLQKRFNLVF